MQTAQILRQLIHSIKTRPFVLASIPWDEILLCITTEFTCCARLYTDAQFQDIRQSFHECIAQAKQHAIEQRPDLLTASLETMIFALETLPEAGHIDTLLEQANFDHACLNHYQNNTIIVLGDSHVNFFSGNELLTFLPIGQDINTCPGNTPYPFTTLHTGPCLAYNCLRPGTSYRFKEKSEYLCRHFIRPHATIICCLGEIDIRVHVFRQSKLQNRPYQQIIDDILTQYLQFLISLKNAGYRVCCWGPIASQPESCPLDPLFPRTGTEIERNRATAYFNRRLRALCQESGITFLSVFEQMITDDYRTLECFLSADHCHLGQTALSLASQEWQKIL